MLRSLVCVALFFAPACLFADGPGDNVPDKVRPIPPVGVEIPDDVRSELEQKLWALRQAINALAQDEAPRVRGLLPDVQIFAIAVQGALEHQEFFDAKDFAAAKKLIELGMERARQLQQGEAPWTTQSGLTVRGYVSKIDGSVQPYGLVVPASYTPEGAHRYRLDLWFHGRGEVVTEVKFLAQRLNDPGVFSPTDTLVVHPFGRYCNAFKFAGEIDVLEALADVQRRYRIDEDRIAVRGFSMGGAACWQFAVHYADRWAAANPGAGFSETARFLNVFQNEKVKPTPWEETLWRWYDCPGYARNLVHCPTVAYSGEIDKQKQAADVMSEALAREGIELTHLIGPGTAHKYHPAVRNEVDRRMALIVAKGRQRVPREVQLTTYTTRYNRMHWVTIDSLETHWSEARVEARLVGSNEVSVKTQNVAALTLSFDPGWAPFEGTKPVMVVVDRIQFRAPPPTSDKSWTFQLHKGRSWREGPAPANGLAKRHGLQGPIDDAFMDSFLFVRPTGRFAHVAVEKWVGAELEHAIEHWRRQFRGQARVKNDSDVTEEDIAGANLVLWGDPSSNLLLAKIADKLPIAWSDVAIGVGNRRFPSENHAPILICPNPLNPERYVVLNSSFTYREYDYLNNARQVPKLPDWAIVDLSVPPNSRYPGKVVAADFFDEAWRVKREAEELR